jgi:capsular exopolysaccharide synthesis family protein
MPEVAQRPSDAPLRPLKVVAEPAPARPLRAEGKPFPPAPAPAATHTAAPPVAFRSAFAEGPAAPCNEAAIDRNLVALLDPNSFEAEQFKILRTNILYPLVGKPPRSILLTSTGPGEGKTFAAANLAISIALNINRYVLLIDADLRQPQLNVRFGFGAVPGLSNYLAEGTPLPSLLLRTRVDKLTLLPSGPSPANPSELISSERMASLLTEVTNRYPDRLIVIDAPPPALAAETGVLARQVDGIIVVVRYGSTRRGELSDLKASLGNEKIIGSVVNYIETPVSRYYGYKYAGYGRRKDM